MTTEERQQAIENYIRDNRHRWVFARDIAEAIGLEPNNVGQNLARMVAFGRPIKRKLIYDHHKRSNNNAWMWDEKSRNNNGNASQKLIIQAPNRKIRRKIRMIIDSLPKEKAEELEGFIAIEWFSKDGVNHLRTWPNVVHWNQELTGLWQAMEFHYEEAEEWEQALCNIESEGLKNWAASVIWWERTDGREPWKKFEETYVDNSLSQGSIENLTKVLNEIGWTAFRRRQRIMGMRLLKHRGARSKFYNKAG
jgi:hypothetical protein